MNRSRPVYISHVNVTWKFPGDLNKKNNALTSKEYFISCITKPLHVIHVGVVSAHYNPATCSECFWKNDEISIEA